mmetsp:Transcript_31705/g.97054  ORF Transcript_31705/g.97054 Transcript_31705/m.97054 type:complete len:135 (-) Transcript_31705:447-851(-)
MSAAAAALAEQGIHADKNGLHLLPPEQANEAATLQEECREFLGKTQQFGEIISDFISVMESRAKVIESEKLKAIGLGNRVDSEQETRKRKQLEIQAMINEKKAELERLNAQYDSMVRVEAEQKALIERLTNNEA